jgi:hypothetical protein
MKKKILLGLLALFAVFAAWAAWQFWLKPHEQFNPLYLIPSNAIYILEATEPVKEWKKVGRSAPWQHMQGNAYVASLTEAATELDALIQENELLFELVGNRPVMVSAHMYRADDYEFLFVADLKKSTRLIPNQWLPALVGTDYTLTRRDYNGFEITELTDRQTRETLYLALHTNLLVGSYQPSLLEAALDQSKAPVLGRDVRFQEINQKTDRGMFRLFVQYKELNKLLALYTNGPNEFVEALTEAMQFTGLQLNMLGEGSLFANGYTLPAPADTSILTALHQAGAGKRTVAEVAPARTAFMFNISVANYNRFWQQLQAQMPAENLTDLQKIERYLNISIAENFMSWLSDELAFVQTQPAGLGKHNEFALILTATDSVAAATNLDILQKQIKRKTPVRFSKVTYKGFPIKFLAVKGFFKLMLGNFFGQLEKPYYTTIGRYVVFSNHPQTLRSIIDNYLSGQTLNNDSGYSSFAADFNQQQSAQLYINTPALYQNIKGFVEPEVWQDLQQNKQYFLCFSRIGLQLTADGRGFNTKMHIGWQPIEQVLAENKAAAKALVQQLEALQTEMFEVEDIAVSASRYEQQSQHEPEYIAADDILPDDLTANKYTETYANGELKLEVNLKNGQKHGSYQEYYPDGTLKVKGRYREGKQHGRWHLYNEQGSRKRTIRYNNGVLKEQ